MNLEQIGTSTTAGRLSPAQAKAVREWSNRERFLGSRNATMGALSQLGLVYWNKPSDIRARGNWSLTPDGQAVQKILRVDLAGEVA